MELFKLVGKIFVDNEEANNSIHKTDREADSLHQKFANGMKTIGKWGTLFAGTVTAGATAMYKMASESAQTADRIDKMSQKLGLSRTGFQELDYIMSQNGSSVESLSGSMKTLLSKMDSVQEGNKVNTELFEQLGVSVTDVDGKLKTTEEVFMDSVKALQQMEDGSEKTRLAQELFGKSSSELIPLLNSENGSIEELQKNAHDLGLVMSDESVDAGVLFTDTMDNLTRAFKAVVTEIGVQVMPIVQKLADWIITHMPEIKKALSVVFDVIQTLVTFTINGISWVIDGVTNMYNKTSATINNWIDKFNWAKAQVKSIIDAIKGFFNFNVSLPHIKLPHFSISPYGWDIGDLLKGSIPRLGIEWYAKAMNEPMVFSEPTILGTSNGFKGVGEAGTEYISGEEGIKNAVREVLGELQLQVVLDSGVLVGEIVNPLDKQLGLLANRKGRGR